MCNRSKSHRPLWCVCRSAHYGLRLQLEWRPGPGYCSWCTSPAVPTLVKAWWLWCFWSLPVLQHTQNVNWSGGKTPQMRSLLAQLFLLDQNASKWRLMLALNYLFKCFCSLGISRVSFRVSTVSQNVLRIAKIPKIYNPSLSFALDN